SDANGTFPIQPSPTLSPIQPTTSGTTTKTTTSSTPPPTTTHKTTTTSTAPTTPSTTAPSTEHPTSTTPEPTTTVVPPTKGHFVVKDGNKTCIIADLAIQVKFVKDNATWEFDVPANASSNGGICNNETQEQDLALSWDDEQGKLFTLNFQFSKNDTSKKFVVSQITLGVPLQNKTLNLTEEEPMFSTSVSKSYRCEKEQEIKLTEEGTNTTYAVLKVSKLQLEAFHTSEDEKFSAAEDCAGSSSPDIVPIAVGCALVGLIAIVLIAYLVGRRRSQARGYLSM
ncbi:Lysosome-associated membrane glycoprotein 1, partial [Gryllus bimaculatus]